MLAASLQLQLLHPFHAWAHGKVYWTKHRRMAHAEPTDFVNWPMLQA